MDIRSLASNQVNKAANARNQQLSMAKAYVQELQNPDHWQQHLEEHNSPGIFIPGGNAKHKAGRGTEYKVAMWVLGGPRKQILLGVEVEEEWGEAIENLTM